MISQVVRLVTLSEFGLLENPLWFVSTNPLVCSREHILSFNGMSKTLVPLENLTEFDIEDLAAKFTRRQQDGIIFQTYVREDENLKKLEIAIRLGFRIQVWI